VIASIADRPIASWFIAMTLISAALLPLNLALLRQLSLGDGPLAERRAQGALNAIRRGTVASTVVLSLLSTVLAAWPW
jgi:hypothetical protein